MKSVVIPSEFESREFLIAALWEMGTVGIIENTDTLQAFFDNDTKLLLALDTFSGLAFEVDAEKELAACFSIKNNSDPVYAGKNFFIVTSWMANPTPLGRHRLTIDANDAFGSGSHESTQLVIQALEEHLSSGATVLDVGCGSGVLSEVAQKLGAGLVFSCDTHLGSIESARRHSKNSYFFAGSVDALKDSMADVVLVNISAKSIDLLANELQRITKPHGLLIISGFIKSQTPANMIPEKAFYLNDWACWICNRESIVMNCPDFRKPLQPFSDQWW